MDASLEILASRGLDLFSISDLATATGLTRAPIYARFESTEDIAIELWRTRVEPSLDALLDACRRWFGEEGPDSPDELASLVLEPTPELAAAVEIIAVARRFPSLAEIVRSDIERLVEAYVDAQDAPRAIAISQISVVLGEIFIGPFVDLPLRGSWEEALDMVRRMSVDRTAWEFPTVIATPIDLDLGRSSEDDDPLGGFGTAIMRVVARGGYENASANRISREAGRSFNGLYGRFESKDEAMAAVVEQWIDSGARLSFEPFVGVEKEEFIRRSVVGSRSMVAPRNRSIRQLRNELSLAARHHDHIRTDTRDIYSRAAASGRGLFERLYSGVDEDALRRLAVVGLIVRSRVAGLVLLAGCTPMFEDVDWTPAAAAMAREFWVMLDAVEPRPE